MATWQKEIPFELADPKKYYFVAKRFGRNNECYSLLGRGKSGKVIWTSKPGIALHLLANVELKTWMHKELNTLLLEIPKDYAKRWSRR